MPTLLWADVVEITHDEAKQSLLDLLDSVGFTATSWQEGEPALACVELSAEIWSQVSKIAVFFKKLALNSTSEGEALTRFSDSHYDNQRAGSVAAQRRTTLVCATGSGPHTFNVGDLVLAHADGDTYRLIDDGVTSFPATLPGGGSIADLIFEAEVAGSAANKAAGSVTQIITTLAGVTVASDLVERSGSDEESDPVLKERNRTKWPRLAEYELIADAVKNIALNATQAVTIVAVDDQNPRGEGTFDVYMAQDLETADASDIAAAQAAFDARVFGSTATPKTCLVFGAPEVALNLSGYIYYQGSYTPADVVNAALAALEEFLKTIPLGGFDFYPGPSAVVPINNVERVLERAQVNGQDVTKTIVLNSPTDLSVIAFGKVVSGTISLTAVPASV